ncbi:unnamed protein product, partial [Didymodactylos carnosus]
RVRLTKRPYLRLLRSFGCHVSFLNIGFYTTSFNRLFFRIGLSNARLWKIWFTCGILCAFVTAIIACLTLLFLPLQYFYIYNQNRAQSIARTGANLVQNADSITSTYSGGSSDTRNKMLIQPIIPGVNVPLEQLPHFFLALLICTVLHEFGHAVAASAEQIRVNGCGYFIFLLYPGAYVDLHQEQLQMISAVRQLRIYCAGVFHNMVLVAIALIFLLINPLIMKHLYTEAATVYSVSNYSPIRDLLPSYSIIRSIDSCAVRTQSDWYSCLRIINDRNPFYQQQPGYCLTQAEIQLHSSHIELNQSSNHDCCKNISDTNYCFLYHSKQYPDLNGGCLVARYVTDHPSCLFNSDCQGVRPDSSCLHPFSADNYTRLIRILHTKGPPILFVGDVHELHRSIRIESYKPNLSYIPFALITDIPLFFKYVGAFSFALAFFNSVPCYALDGQYILQAFVEYISPSLYKRRRLSVFYGTVIGTLLLVVNVTLAFIQYFI